MTNKKLNFCVYNLSLIEDLKKGLINKEEFRQKIENINLKIKENLNTH